MPIEESSPLKGDFERLCDWKFRNEQFEGLGKMKWLIAKKVIWAGNSTIRLIYENIKFFGSQNSLFSMYYA